MLNFHRYSKFVLPSLVLFGLLGCDFPTTTNNQVTEDLETETEVVDLPLVVATTDVICDLTRQIAQETIDLNCLVSAGIDPHVYQATPDDRRAIDQADVILYGGYGFEPNLINLVDATDNTAPKIAVYEEAVANPLMMTEDDGHDHGHSHGDGDEFPDPHVWHDASNGMSIVNVISEQLALLQPGQAQLYQDQASMINNDLEAMDGWIKAQIETIPTDQRILVSNHDALGYFVEAYGLQSNTALQGVSTEEAPTAGRVGELVRKIQNTNVPTIFVESSVNPTLINTVANEAGVQVADNPLFADGLGESGSGAETYQQKLMLNTQTVVEGLEGSFSPFQG
ncbi:Mn transporter MntC [Cyanobacterium sp. HL-69]|uniref:metal ABC transporter solute-binding protein, Zn/Mn family n=1 Tax=Cyanobacterium sp. HL-69 TaxID=2054282 RepID=UPI000CA2A580|nr:Mn transporter MntC [Cyanobacterium sp. HL-69]